MIPQDFWFGAERRSVSRETLSRLTKYVELIEKWNPSINLISKGSLREIWDRHIQDSAQLYDLMPSSARLWLDIGSGGGLPGLVIAILAKEFSPGLRVELVESDQRKCAFLTVVSRALYLNTKISNVRIESRVGEKADVVSARALSRLANLLSYAQPHLKTDAICVFPKGAKVADEIEEARRSFTFDLVTLPSETDSDASLLVLREISHV